MNQWIDPDFGEKIDRAFVITEDDAKRAFERLNIKAMTEQQVKDTLLFIGKKIEKLEARVTELEQQIKPPPKTDKPKELKIQA